MNKFTTPRYYLHLIIGQWKDARDLFLSLNINEISIEVYKKINTEVNNYIELNY